MATKQMIAQGSVPEGSTGYKIIGAASITVRESTQVFAMEMATHKIAVIAYAPGIVGMAMWDLINEKLGEMEGRKKGERVTRHAVDLTVMKRVSVLDDVAEEFRGRYWTTAKCEPE